MTTISLRRDDGYNLSGCGARNVITTISLNGSLGTVRKRSRHATREIRTI